MEIVAINGSPSGTRGNTHALLSALLRAAEGEGARTEVIQLADTRIEPCRACDVCHVKGNCPQADAFEVVKRRILEADALVLGSPNHVFNVSAQLKAFIDRCCGVIHTMAFRGLYGASVVTSGGGEEAPVAELMNRFLMATGVVPVGSVWATMGGREKGDIPTEVASLAAELGRDLVRAVEEGGDFPQAREWIEAFEGRMKTLVERNQEVWPHEYAHWRALQETV